MDCNIFHKNCKKCQETCPFHATVTGLDGKTKTDKITMNKDTAHEIGVNIELAKSLMADKIYESDASALREQYTNALSHGCVAYHDKYGYTDDVYVDITFDHGERTVTIRDNGMGMSKETFKNVFMYFGNSTVSEKENNKRSGMFGLGAISFFRIASSCIVESYHRETGEHYSFMTRGKNVTEILDGNKIMLGGEHNPEKGVIGDYGTSTKIFLKDHIKIRELVNMVKVVGANYPARTLLHVVNSEGEQSIQTYQQHDQDEEIELPAVKTFEDFVKLKCGENHSYTKVLDDEHVEVYITSVPAQSYRDRCDSYLCRVPIKIEIDKFNEYHFNTFVNIKQEKYHGINDEGEEELLAIPMTNRDRVDQRADEWLDKHLTDTVIPELQKDNHFTTVQEFRDITSTWMHLKYNMENIYDEETQSFVNRMRLIRVRRRNIEHGLSKTRDEHDLWELIKRHSHIFYHPTCHLDSFNSVTGYLMNKGIDKKQICVIGETVEQKRMSGDGEQVVNKDSDVWANGGKERKGMVVHDFTGLSVIDIKEFKRAHTIKSVKSSSYDNPTYDSGAKVWIVNNYGASIDFTEDSLNRRKIKPENVYWAGDYIKYSDIRNSRLVIIDNHRSKHIFTGKKSEKYGLIVAKKYPKSVPNIDKLFEEVEDLLDSGEVYMWDIDSNKKIFFEEDWYIEKEGRSWDCWEGENEEGTKVNWRYTAIKVFDSEKSTALTNNNSALIKRGFAENIARHYDEPELINYFIKRGESNSRHGVMFAPSKMIEAVALYFRLKHDAYITSQEANDTQLEDLKHFPQWIVADDIEWDEYYKEKETQATINKQIHLRNMSYDELRQYPTIVKMVEWAREGLVKKFENVIWCIDEIERTPEPDGDGEDKGLDEDERKTIETRAMDLLLKLHPTKKMMIDIIKCNLTKDDCITVRTRYDNGKIRELKSVDETDGTYELFIKQSKLPERVRHHSNDGNPSIHRPTIYFNDVTIEDGKITYVMKDDINMLIDDDWYYHNNELYYKYNSWQWGHSRY